MTPEYINAHEPIYSYLLSYFLPDLSDPYFRQDAVHEIEQDERMAYCRYMAAWLPHKPHYKQILNKLKQLCESDRKAVYFDWQSQTVIPQTKSFYNLELSFLSRTYPHIGEHPRLSMSEIDVAKALLNDRMIDADEYSKCKKNYLVKLRSMSEEYRSSELISLMRAGLLTRGEASKLLGEWGK